MHFYVLPDMHLLLPRKSVANSNNLLLVESRSSYPLD